jgi:hypothetical protein
MCLQHFRERPPTTVPPLFYYQESMNHRRLRPPSRVRLSPSFSLYDGMKYGALLSINGVLASVKTRRPNVISGAAGIIERAECFSTS